MYQFPVVFRKDKLAENLVMKRMPLNCRIFLYIVLFFGCWQRVAHAQPSLLVVPNYTTNSQIAGAGDGMFASIGRVQSVYGASEFPSYPIIISKIQWRPDSFTGGAITNALISNIQINLSTTTNSADQLSSVFGQNIGTNDTVVFSGNLNLSTAFITQGNGTTAFDINVPLQTAFAYDPSKGNLLVDVRNFSGCTANIFDNSTSSGFDTVSRVFSSDANATIAGASDSGGGVIQVTYTPVAAPTITAQPTNQIIFINGIANFIVTAVGAPPLSYQWFFNSLANPISEGTNNSLTFSNAQTNQSGIYFVQATGPSGMTLSSNALLTVVPALITSQPMSQAVALGGTATFAITAESPEPLSYQWFFNVTNVISGATNSSLILTSVQADQVGLYSVQVSNIDGRVNSSNASLSLELIVPNYAANFQSDNTVINTLVSVLRLQTVYGASQFPPYPIVITELRWRPDALAGGPLTDDIPNIQISLSTTVTNADDLNSTFAKNSGANDTIVFSGVATVSTSFTTLSNRTRAFDISLPLQTPFVYDSAKGNLLVDVQNFSGGSAILYTAGLTSITDTVSRAYSANPDAITASGEDTGGDVMQIIYTPAPLPPTISSQPTNLLIIVGDTASFSVAAGPQPLSYQWFYNTNTVLDGETNSTLVLTNVQLNRAGTYSVVVANGNGMTLSSNALLTVVPAFITSQPISQTVAMGGTATFAVTAESTEPLSYQWFFNITNMISGATNASLILTNVQADRVGLYSVRVSNTYGVVNSSNASLYLGVIVPNYGAGFQVDNNAHNSLVSVLRLQTVYGASQFPPYPIVITELRWRPDTLVDGPLTDNIPNIQISLSTTATNADDLNSIFAKNSGTNDTMVFSGVATVSTSFTTLSNSTKAFDISLPLQTPFVYESSKGNLLVDVRNFSGGSAILYTAGLTSTTDTVSRAYSDDPNSTTASGADTALRRCKSSTPRPRSLRPSRLNRRIYRLLSATRLLSTWRPGLSRSHISGSIIPTHC